MDKRKREQAFPIEMSSKKHLSQISVSDEPHQQVLFEGFLGELEELDMIEGATLGVKGADELTKGMEKSDLKLEDYLDEFDYAEIEQMRERYELSWEAGRGRTTENERDLGT